MLFSTKVRVRGKYKFEVAERPLCRTIACSALSPEDREIYKLRHGEEFDGSGPARLRLDAATSHRVDEAILRSMREDVGAWGTSEAEVVVPREEWADNLVVNRGLDRLGAHAITFDTFASVCVLGTGATPPSFSDTALTTEIVRTSNKLSSNTTNDNSTRTRTITNVFDFPAETVNRNYAELGLSDTGTAGANLTTHALISGGTVTVLIGQQARVSYAVLTTIAANYTATPTVTGDTSAFGSSSGTMAFCTLDVVGSHIVSSSPGLWLGTGSTIPPFGTIFTPGTTAYSSSSAFSTYVTGSFSSVRTSTWDLGTGNGTAWRSVGPGTGASPSQYSFAFVFDSAKTKDNTHTLTITWAVNYSR